ncbi:MAG TPA: hypothetical protein PKY87_15245 [Terricaulis sp.]|nr:hypothetical protein [Terricaulis sp.]
MADPERRGGSGWTAFLAGIVLVAVLGLGVYAFTSTQQRDVADMQIEMPDVKITPPEIDLPEPPPAPQMPPSAEEEAPVQPPTP